MDIEARESLSRLIKEITETGEWSLESGRLKTIKSLCKKSNANVRVVFDLIFVQLKKEHAQIRYSCLQLCEVLFQRSHLFRELLADEFPTFMQLTVGIHEKKLPLPAHVALKLKQFSIALIKSWYQSFGDKLRPLGIGYDYLEHHSILGQEVSLRTIHTRDSDTSNKEARLKAIHARRYEQVKQAIQENLDLVQDNLKNMNGCFDILVPRNAEDDSAIDFEALMKGDIESTMTQGETYKESILSHGLGSNRYSITINMGEDPLSEQVKESDDNGVIYEQLREAYRVLERKHIKQVNGWINSLVKIEYTDKAEKDSLIKTLIHCKADMMEVARKANLLGITAAERRPSVDSEKDDDDDEEDFHELFEDIPTPEHDPGDRAESSTAHITVPSAKLPPAQRIFPLSYELSMTNDVTYGGPRADLPAARIPKIEKSHDKGKGKEKEDSVREALLKVAPVVEWGDDLYYWDKTNVQFNTSGIERSHRFMGVGEGTNEMPKELLDELRKRTIYYKDKTPGNIKACRYPLRSGGLCPRRDLVACPFHGKIIPRDEVGRPSDPAASTAEASNSGPQASNSNLWETIENEVMVQAGQERIEPNSKKRKKKKEASGLIDIRKKPETSYTRLQKKLDDPKMRHIVEEAAEYEQSMKARNRQASTWK